MQFYRALGTASDRKRKAAYPADPSDGRSLYRGAIREHLVKVTPKQMHLVSSQINLQLTDKFLSRSAGRPGGRCGSRHGSRGSSASSQRRIGSPHCEARNPAPTPPAACSVRQVRSGATARRVRAVSCHPLATHCVARR